MTVFKFLIVFFFEKMLSTGCNGKWFCNSSIPVSGAFAVGTWTLVLSAYINDGKIMHPSISQSLTTKDLVHNLKCFHGPILDPLIFWNEDHEIVDFFSFFSFLTVMSWLVTPDETDLIIFCFHFKSTTCLFR